MEAFAHKADAEAFCRARGKEGPVVRYQVEEIPISKFMTLFEKKKTAAEAAAS